MFSGSILLNLGKSVYTDYGQFRNYKVFEIDFNKTPKSKFAHASGEMSFIEYYKKNYEIKIVDENQPLLVY